jgi:RNA polymerase sigma factor (TIGR02999 family)
LTLAVRRSYTGGVPRSRAPSNVPAGEVTRLLQAWNEGDAAARDRLIPVVYDELRRRAAAHLRRERRDHTLRPTDLVHETYLRLCEQNSAWQNRDQFFGVASRLMRRILVDHARARGAAKRGRGLRVTLVEGLMGPAPSEPDLLDLDAALDELQALDDRQGRLVELRFFGGLTLEEGAEVLGVSRATANREWAMAKAWLFRRLKQGLGPLSPV